MEKFVVPQFIEVEDKIFGPITVRQFVIILIDGIVLAILYKLVDLALFVVFLALFGGFGLVLAFVKINGQVFHYFLLNVFETLKKPSVRIWLKKISDAELKFLTKTEPPPPPRPVYTKEARLVSHLSELALVVDTGGKYEPEE